jgi:hypothetical protein
VRTKVLYVVGTQRGGTTIAGRLMGQMSGFAFFGELRKLWQVGLPEGRACGCGRGYQECEVWSRVLPEVLAATDPARVQAWQRTAAPDHRSSWRAWQLARRSGARQDPKVRSYTSLLGATYRALAEATGASVVIDTSKLPADGVLMSGLDDIDPYVLQLVRDPRGTVYSAVRRGDVEAGAHVHPRQVLTGSAGWLVRHVAGIALRRHVGAERSLVVTYEQLVAEPRSALAAVAALVDEPAPPDAIVVEGKADLGVAHTPIGGGRFRPRTVELTRDDRWTTGLGTFDRLAIGVLTQPLAHHLGYRFSTTARRAPRRGVAPGVPCPPSRHPGA